MFAHNFIQSFRKKWVVLRYRQAKLDVPPVFVAIPFLVPLITPLATIVSAIVFGGIAIVALIAGLSGGVKLGSIIGGLLGAAIAMGLALVVSRFFYIALPPIFFFLAVLVYVFISIGEQATGHSLVTKLFGKPVSVRLVCLLSIMIVGLMTFTIFAIFDAFELFTAEYKISKDAFLDGISELERKIIQNMRVITDYMFSIGFLYSVFTVFSISWIITVMFGANFLISASVQYCIEVFVLAFLIDLLFTLTSVFLIFQLDLDPQPFVNFINAVDLVLRQIALAPIELMSYFFEDLRDLASALRELLATVSNLISLMIETGVQTVFLTESGVKRFVLGFLDFADALRVDFIFFLVASAIWFVRVNRVLVDDDARLTEAGSTRRRTPNEQYTNVLSITFVVHLVFAPTAIVVWNGVDAVAFPKAFDYQIHYETRRFGNWERRGINSSCSHSVRVEKINWMGWKTYTCKVRDGYYSSHSRNWFFMIFWSFFKPILLLLVVLLFVSGALFFDSRVRQREVTFDLESYIANALEKAKVYVITRSPLLLGLVMITVIASIIAFEIRVSDEFRAIRR